MGETLEQLGAFPHTPTITDLVYVARPGNEGRLQNYPLPILTKQHLHQSNITKRLIHYGRILCIPY